jgi:ankyrin repeat protein
MAQWKFGVSALILASMLPTVQVLAASPLQPDSRLVEAVKHGDKTAFEALLSSHIAVDSAYGDGSTALHWAAYQANTAFAEELLAAKANVNAVTRVEALTPLYMACQSGSTSMIELLLKHGADVNQANSLGTTPLMIASASGSAEVVKVLLDHGADANQREHAHDQTALMFAANLDRAEVIRVLMAHGADPNLVSKVVTIPKINFKGSNFATSITQPTKESAGKIEVGKATPASDSKTHQQTATYPSKSAEKMAIATSDAKLIPGSVPDRQKPSALPAEVASADEKKVDEQKPEAAPKKIPREYGAKLMGGMSPLLYAARQGNIAAATALLDGGAKINEVSGSEHTTPLVLAIANGHYDFAAVLVNHGANVNLANDMGVTPLFATIDVRWVPRQWSAEPIVDQEKVDYLQLMKMLLDHGENPNAQLGKQIWSRVLSENRNWTDPAGATAFWRSAQADDVKAMQLLKEGGADPNIASKIGTTPLMVAAGLGWSANYHQTSPTRLLAIAYCISLGADVNARDDLGYTPLHGAAFVGDLKNIKFLVDKGAKTDVKTKAGDSVADLANGPFEKSLPNPEAVALLEKLGSPNSHNCRSSDCVPPVKEDKPTVAVAAETKPEEHKKPVASEK